MANFRFRWAPSPCIFAVVLLLAPLGSAAQTLNDPANLAGERVAAPSLADTLPINHGAPALQQLLLKLRTRASMMLIVAHPDDEDGGLLTYESRGQGARVAMLTLTRGEGGQNLMSADFDDALGLIRTQELLAADRYFGVDQMFGTEVDFGFSKTKEETLAKWTHDRVLYDAVRAVRLYRPLVLASVFVGGPTDGHGHHQVSGEICQEVFNAAADPKVFPEMIAEGLLPWAPLKVYARVPFSRVTPDGMFDYATGKTIPTRFHNYVTGVDTTAEPVATVEVHEGEKSTALGMDGDSYVQFARKGLALQKTQIGNGVRLAPAGAFDAGYTLMGSRVGKGGGHAVNEQSLFDGVDTTLPGIATLAPSAPASLREELTKIDTQLAEAQKTFAAEHPEATIPALRRALKAIDTIVLAYSKASGIPEGQRHNLLHELRIKRVQVNDALLLAHGVSMTATLEQASSPLLTTSTSARIAMKLSNRGDQGLVVLSENSPATHEPPLSSHPELLLQREIKALSGFPATRPYFSRPNIEQPFYDLSDWKLRNAPATPPPLIVSQYFEDEGTRLEMKAVVASPGSSAPVQAALAVPPASVSVSPTIGIIPRGEKTFEVKALMDSTPFSASANKVTLFLQNGAKGRGEAIETKELPSTRTALPLAASFTIDAARLTKQRSTFIAVVTQDHHDYAEGYRSVGYRGLTLTNDYTAAAYRATAVDVKTAPGLKIAYLPGTGDMVSMYLPYLGITPAILSAKDVTPEKLKQYDAIVLGVRAYAAQSYLEGAGSKPLLEYAREGGVVIVQYMTAHYGDAEAPFPITVPGDSAHNVVEEAQPVTLLHPDNPLLAWPNHITSADFDHWVAERGHGFAASWDSHYLPLTETHDPEQAPQEGGLLYARTGKGAYIYVAYALYRQLPEGVPGAYRLFANMLSLGKNPAASGR
ncbi:PIG-L family deacetylase [Granulicella arctica]|uniref:PIG-L family deacetylase n=1 Tax=Granulicella arctica TaxID=940613 RepID=UPI0021DF4E04|nr:PIG-L family deacetylase [Granulicella arctica]